MKKSKFIIVPFLTILLFTISCEKDSDSFYTENYIDIPNIEHPETLLNKSNRETYNIAYKRFQEQLELVDGKYSIKVDYGREIEISEALFNYMKENIEIMNDKVDSGEGILYEEKGEIIFAYKELQFKTPLFSIGDESFQGRTDLHVDSFGRVVTSAFSTFESYRAGGMGRDTNLSDAYVLGSGLPYQVDRGGNYTVNGHYMYIHVASACQGPCEYNSGNTYISTPKVGASNGGAYYQIRNNQGNTLVTIRTYDSSGTAYVDARLGY